MADVFISYAKAQPELTEGLARDLAAVGLSAWWDTSLLPGENFRNEIDDQLNACRAAVVIWTLEAIKSDWVIAEADHAWQQKKLVNTHVPELKPYQIPKPFNQIHSVGVANRAAIIDAVRKRIAQHERTSTTAFDASASNSDRTRKGQAAPDRGRVRFVRWTYGLLGLAGVVLVAALVGLVFLGIIPGPTSPTAATPTWDFSGDLFIGQPIPLAWKYDRSAPVGFDRSKPEASILFELSSSGNARFGPDTRMETYADGDHKYMAHINATRFWRVRAVASQTKTPLSDWSLAIPVTQYDSAYDRIKATQKVLVYVSNAEIQAAFKWVDDKGFRGFDIKLADLIVQELSARTGRAVEMIPIPVPWTQLLDAPSKGRADFIISSITRLETRKRDFGIDFSDAYYCTTHALIYRIGTPDRPIREMIAGKIVGVQDKTTNAHLAEEMAKGGLFDLKTFTTTETLIAALLGSEIDYGVADTPFALTAKFGSRSNGRDRLGVKEFQNEDFPASISEEERVEQYAIAVRSGEYELLDAIDRVISGAKQDGSMARLLKEAALEFEDALGVPRGSRGSDAANDRSGPCPR